VCLHSLERRCSGVCVAEGGIVLHIRTYMRTGGNRNCASHCNRICHMSYVI